MKRAFDLVAATAMLLVVLPVLVICCVGCAITLRANPFFVQTRIGQDNKPFRFVKLRTLPPATPPYADKYQLDLDALPRFTMWLRRLHLDELPQLVLVATGKMSLVGPRPEMPMLHRGTDPSFAHERTRVLPGCTGLWQIGDENHRLIAEAPEYDRFYLYHRTFRLDLWIIGRSIRALLPGAVRIGLEDIPAWTGAVPWTVVRPSEVRMETVDPSTRVETAALAADA